MARFWLLKCEPDVYAIHDLERDGRTGWDSVRNYQVRNFMRDEMKPGDLGIFYHSNADPSGAAGLLRITRTALADPTQFDRKSEAFDPKARPSEPTWLMCEVEFVERFAEVVPLERLRAEPALSEMQILRRGNRLSITPLTESEYRAIAALGGAGGKGRSSAGGAARASTSRSTVASTEPRSASASARKSR